MKGQLSDMTLIFCSQLSLSRSKICNFDVQNCSANATELDLAWRWAIEVQVGYSEKLILWKSEQTLGWAAQGGSWVTIPGDVEKYWHPDMLQFILYSATLCDSS